MISIKLALPGLCILCALQLYITASMISKNETTISTGQAWKFRTAPVDPNDPFRGKYIVLSFTNTDVEVPDASIWNYGDLAYATLVEDSAGYARIRQIHQEIPAEEYYLSVKISSVINSPGEQRVYVEFPFDRFYLEEKKAPEAEKTYRQAMSDGQKDTYALVYIKDGQGVLTDVIVGDRTIRTN